MLVPREYFSNQAKEEGLPKLDRELRRRNNRRKKRNRNRRKRNDRSARRRRSPIRKFGDASSRTKIESKTWYDNTWNYYGGAGTSYDDYDYDGVDLAAAGGELDTNTNRISGLVDFQEYLSALGKCCGAQDDTPPQEWQDKNPQGTADED